MTHVYTDLDELTAIMTKPERNSLSELKKVASLVGDHSLGAEDSRMLLETLGLIGKGGKLQKCEDCDELKIVDEDCMSSRCVQAREEFEREEQEKLEAKNGSK